MRRGARQRQPSCRSGLVVMYEKETHLRRRVQVSRVAVCNWPYDLGFHRAEGKPGYTLTEEREVGFREYHAGVTKAFEVDREPTSPCKVVQFLVS